MFKKMLTLSIAATLLAGLGQQVQAQSAPASTSYKSGVGARLDFGSGGTYFGVAGKHFFTEQGAGEAHVMFASGATMIGAEYQHHFAINSAPGLKWYGGGGVGLLLYKSSFYFEGGTSFLIRPVVGLDYKIQSAPVALGFDWRPMIQVNRGGGFEGARFGLAARYTF